MRALGDGAGEAFSGRLPFWEGSLVVSHRLYPNHPLPGGECVATVGGSARG